tara:strand:+ start:959 stop:1327 length:369 start_codon:yes stop_codon:yes gene_type:complete
MTATTTGKATPRPWGYVHHKGLDQHLVGGTLENVAIIEDRHENAAENAALIVKAVNAHHELVGWTAAYRDHLAANHYKCDVDDDENCRAEEYGDGDVGEHEDYRLIYALLEQVFNAAKGETR